MSDYARCQGVTSSGRACSRDATKHYITKAGTCFKHLCTQHSRGAGVMKLLRPYPWEYDRVESYLYDDPEGE